MFQLKNFTSIVASMVNHIRGATTKLTDFNVGSVTRTLIEAPAVEIDELYQQMFAGLKEAIPAAIYTSFDFTLREAAAAAGWVTFSTTAGPAAQAIVIPAATAVQVPGGSVQYRTTQEAIIPAGSSSVSAWVIADTPGVIGNSLAGAITEMANPIAGVGVTNLLAFVSGRDVETESERKLRFREYIRSLSRAPVASLEYGAKTAELRSASGDIIEYVTQALVVEPYLIDNANPLGYVDLYIFNGIDSASAELVALTQRIIDGYRNPDGSAVMGWKAAGVIVTVQPVTKMYQDVTVSGLEVQSGYTVADVQSAVAAAIRAHIAAIEIGAELVRNRLVDVIMSVDGVYDAVLDAPAGNVAGVTGGKFLPGTVTVTA